MAKRLERPHQQARVVGSNNVVDQRVIVYRYSFDSRVIQFDGGAPRERLIGCPNGRQPSLSNELFEQVSYMSSIACEWVERVQNPDGGLPDDIPGSKSCAWTTAGLLWAYWVRTGSRPRWWHKSLRWLASQSNTDGGLPIVEKGDWSTTDGTSLALLALTGLDSSWVSELRVQYVEWLLDARLQRGGWPWILTSNEDLVASTAFAAVALASCLAMDSSDGTIGRTLGEVAAWLISSRNPDGGWGSTIGGGSRPANTGLALYALSVLGVEPDPRSIAFMKEKSISGWGNTLERAASHNITRSGSCYGLLGIASCVTDEHSSLLHEGIRQLLSGFDTDSYVLQDSDTRSWPTRDFILAASSVIST